MTTRSQSRPRMDDLALTQQQQKERYLREQRNNERIMAAMKANKMHSCVYCTTGTPKGFNARTAVGTCAHKQQVGAPCRWSNAMAHQCPLYRPKHANGPVNR